MKLSTIVPALAGLLACAAACGERAQFQPTQNVTAVSPSGHPAASYDLRGDPETGASADPEVTVNVWSEGAQREDDRTYVDLGLEVRNQSSAPIAVDRGMLALEAFASGGAPLGSARLVGATAEKGSYEIAPRSASTVRLRFELPAAIAPSELGALRFRWGITRGRQDRYTQFTQFRREPEQVATAYVHHYPVLDFYDPFFYRRVYGRPLYYVPVRSVTIQRRGSRPAPESRESRESRRPAAPVPTPSRR